MTTEWHPVHPDDAGHELDQLRKDYNRLEDELAEMRDRKDQAYLERNHLVAVLARLYPSGTRPTTLPGWDAEWHGCVYIDLPDDQQISYHYHHSQAALFQNLPPYTKPYNGHTKDMVHTSLESLWTWNRLIPAQWLYDWLAAARTHDSLSVYDMLTRLEDAAIRYQVAKVRGCNPEDI